MGVEDEDFFIDTRQTTLPLVGVSIPTFSFFIFAPILGTALYAYLHLHIRKVAEALGEADATPNDRPLEEQIKPWLLNDVLLKMRRDGATRDRLLDLQAAGVTLLLVWLAGPIVFFMFWVRSWPAHAELLSFLLLICFWVSVHVGLNSWIIASQAAKTGKAPDCDTRSATWELCYGLGMIAAFLAFGWYTGVKTESGVILPPEERNPWNTFWTELAPIDLENLRTVELPPDQLDYASARRLFRVDWCGRENLDMSLCGPFYDWHGAVPASLSAARSTWCQTNSADLATNCDRHFQLLDARFDRDWDFFRSAQFAALAPPNLSGADLRNANLRGAVLLGVNLEGARLQGSVFVEAQIQGADFRRAQMQGADFGDAQMQGADLLEAHIQGANFRFSRLQGARLELAQMQGADLSSAEMEGANLVRALLQGADLELARMQGAFLFRAQMQGAFLRSAEMEGAYLRSANIQGANLEQTRLEGADLSFVQLQGTLLRETHLQGANLSRARLQGADLQETDMQGANLSAAQLQGALLDEVQFSDETILGGIELSGAAIRVVDDVTLSVLRPFWGQVFGDGSLQDAFVTVTEGDASSTNWPTHWSSHYLDARTYEDEDCENRNWYRCNPLSSPFENRWSTWAATLDPPVTIAPDYRAD
ncbi:MAG: pentapeptide repeat-containing protein [Pseudomonadota bacterium]